MLPGCFKEISPGLMSKHITQNLEVSESTDLALRIYENQHINEDRSSNNRKLNLSWNAYMPALTKLKYILEYNGQNLQRKLSL